jgi:Flp pilus assembly pilin Flp
MARIVGLLISGASVRIGGAVAAIYVAVTVGNYVTDVFAHVNAALTVLP